MFILAVLQSLVNHCSRADSQLHTVRSDGLCATLCQHCCECCVVLILMLNRCRAQLRISRMSRCSHLPVRLLRCSPRQCLVHWRFHPQRSARSPNSSSGLRCCILTSVSRLSPRLVFCASDSEKQPAVTTHISTPVQPLQATWMERGV